VFKVWETNLCCRFTGKYDAEGERGRAILFCDWLVTIAVHVLDEWCKVVTKLLSCAGNKRRDQTRAVSTFVLDDVYFVIEIDVPL
jgi:hypothetical protein